MARRSQASEAAQIVAQAADVAAEKVAVAAKSAVDSATSAAAAAASAAQIVGAVATAKLEGLEKQFEHHERLDADRFASLAGWMKTTFFTLVGAVGCMAFYLLTQRGH